MFIGEWMETRGTRNEMVIATKVILVVRHLSNSTYDVGIQYTNPYKRSDDSVGIKVNYGGSNVKSLHVSVEESLQKLRTSYIDILYVHFWDWGVRYVSGSLSFYPRADSPTASRRS